MTNAGHLWRDSAVSVQILQGRAVCGGVNITNLLAGFIKLLWLAGGLFGSLIDPIFSFFINIFVCAKRTRILTLARCDKIIRSSNYSGVSGAGGGLHRPSHLCIGIMVWGCLEL